MKGRNINFDKNATCMPSKKVLKAIRRLYKEGYSNPSSVYFDGRKTKALIEEARQKTANALGCDADEIFFTSGASESNSWVYLNFANCLEIHPSSHHSLSMLKEGSNLLGIKAFPYVVSETGKVLGAKTRNNDDVYFVDLTQAIGKIYINLHEHSEIIFASASGHKIGAILGCGILYIKHEYQDIMKPLIYGTQEKRLRGGTENVPAIHAFGVAIEDSITNLEKSQVKIFKITNFLHSNIDSRIKKHGGHLNVVNITFNKLLATTAVQLFDKYGFNVSAGSACNSKDEMPSQAYLEEHYTREEALRTIRISVDSNNTLKEAKKFIKTLKAIIDNYDV